MSTFTSCFLITLVLFFFSTIEARGIAPAVSPTHHHHNPTHHHHHHHHHEPAASPAYYITKSSHGEDVEEELVDVSEICEGAGEEECLMRRSLEANIDYIYTQKNP